MERLEQYLWWKGQRAKERGWPLEGGQVKEQFPEQKQAFHGCAFSPMLQIELGLRSEICWSPNP